jgi:ATP-dependent RNA helicase DeaD
MTEQQQQHEDPSCAVDLSASALPEDKKEVDQEEVLTTTIESSTAEPSTTEASTTEVTAEVTADEAKSEPQSGFDGFGFSEALLKTLADKGYSDPFTDPKGSVPGTDVGPRPCRSGSNRYR